MNKKLLTITEVLEKIPMSKAGLYKLCAEEKIESIKLGRRIFINAEYLDRLISGQNN